MKAIALFMALLAFGCRTTAPSGRDRSASYASAIESKMPKLTRIELFGGKADSGYFFRLDFEQKILEGTWNELEDGRPVEWEATRPLADAEIALVKKHLSQLKSLSDKGDCDNAADSSQTLMIGDVDEDLLYEAVAEGDNRCSGPYVDLAGYMKLQKEVEGWLPASSRKRKAPAA